MQEMWNAPPGFRAPKSASAPCSPAKPLAVSRTRSESFHITHKVPVGDTPYVRAKHVQLVDKDPERAIPLFWAAINAGDRVDSALKDMAIVMKQQNRAEEAIEAIKSLRSRCSDQAQESLDNILLDLYKRCGRLDDQIALLRHKLYLIQQGLAFNGKRTKTARSQGKKFQVSVEQEATRLLGNLGWALMQQNNYIEAEDSYRRALSISPDNNKMCNLGICLMKQGRISEAKETLRRVRPAVSDGPRGVDSHLKAYERAQQMLADLESELMQKAGDSVAEQSRLFNTLLGSSSIWQPQPCRETFSSNHQVPIKTSEEFPDENTISRTNYPVNNVISTQQNYPPKPLMMQKAGDSVSEQSRGFNTLLGSYHHHPPSTKTSDEFPDENTISITNPNTNYPINTLQNYPPKPLIGGGFGNSLNIGAPPFYSSKFVKEQPSFNETLKRTRSSGLGGEAREVRQGRSSHNHNSNHHHHHQERENKMLRRSLSFEKLTDKSGDFLLPDDKDFEEAIISAVLSTIDSDSSSGVKDKKKMGVSAADKRLKVFQDITLSLSPRA